MHHSSRRRLTAAVVTVLAVTLGAGAVTGSAWAASAAPGASAVAAPAAVTSTPAPVPYPKDSPILGAGVTGFLTRPDSERPSPPHWSLFGDGSGQDVRDSAELRSTRTDDFLVSRSVSGVTQRNMTTSATFEVRTGPSDVYVGSAADAVFTRTTAADGGQVLTRHTKRDGDVPVTGFPAGASGFAVGPGTVDHALVTFTSGGTARWGLIDLAAGTVGELRVRPPAATGHVAVSATRVVWTEGGDTDPVKVVLLDRATGATRQLPVPSGRASLKVGLVGGWVVYGEPGALSRGTTLPFDAFTAYHPGTGAKVPLLDHLTSVAAGPDGSLYARGGTVAGGEGLYRIASTGDERPTAVKVATTGEPTKIVIGASRVPSTLRLADSGEKASLGWDLSRSTARVKMTLRHTGTGKTYVAYEDHPVRPAVTFLWPGQVQGTGGAAEAAPNGAYTWELSAAPLNGIGPTAVARGSFTVARGVQPHDLNDNGTPDLLMRDASGRLVREDTYYSPYHQDGRLVGGAARTSLGGGWNVYDRIEATGDLAGSPVGDLVARDKAGVLWLYQGTGKGGFAPRVRVGGGWGVYERLAGGSDLTGDGRADLVAADKQGVLWLYKGTGDAKAPLAARKRIGGGWGVYNDLVATGNLGGAAAGDLVARDKAGVLWLYLGRGDGTFAPRVRVGGGWGAFTQLVAVGDANGDKRPDLLAMSPDGNYLYQSTGKWAVPFKPGEIAQVSRPFGGGQLIG
ncbi:MULTISPECIES: FG-GAP repeat domain-containing protein [unclassified Streptomyces]|uniref:FG-GAP repeat domain-containing protein n=1 Tax=unclassified Streptomyces TaxID=2593676 RepID=UPI001660A532|nr:MULTISPECIES: VCBS repeat-containing protein [unclassified Streptomyces]MBD0709381.1 hypothetical protein [Streptomyces sp. CBMA291]MBD0713856.1 hypothetical protein [Streptomyces sp. CBMA370]